MHRLGSLLIAALLLNSLEAASQANSRAKVDSTRQTIHLKVLPRNFYNQHLGFFCKKEVQLQKLTRLPLFIRLGSKEHVDYLERKPNAVKKN